MLLALAQLILDGFALILDGIVSILPLSPFGGLQTLMIDSKWLGYMCYFLPIPQILALLESWGTAVAIYYLYMIPMRWIKAIGG